MKQVYKACFSLLVLLSLSQGGNAQWHKLKGYQNPYTGANACTATLSYPIFETIGGNGEIIYGAYCGPTGPYGGFVISESKNDLDTSVSVFGDGGLGCCFDYTLASKNVSVQSFIYDKAGVQGIYFTTSYFSKMNFITNFYGQNTNSVSTSFSPNYLYVVWHTSSFSSDSLITYLCTLSPITATAHKNFKYTSPVHLYFPADSSGYMLCIHRNDSASVLAKTSDSGKTWRDSFLDSIHIITSCCFPTPSIGYLTENNGNIYKTTDAGLTWVQLTSPTIIALRCVSFSNATNGYIGGYGGILYKTTTGGTSWTTETSNDTLSINSLYTFDTIAYFIDASNNIYKNEKPLGIEKLQATGPFANVFPNPSNGKFSVELKTNNEKLKIEVYSILGEEIYSTALPQTPIGALSKIDLSSQPNGIYLYQITSETGGYITSGKLIIQK
ncbi:MAG TPA: T9SS type A sorting domain-containing protein [Bacteroidia bacterium]|nr:T9SS type A sorting domain-containing protein [Bacteroidia bacterium]